MSLMRGGGCRRVSFSRLAAKYCWMEQIMTLIGVEQNNDRVINNSDMELHNTFRGTGTASSQLN